MKRMKKLACLLLALAAVLCLSTAAFADTTNTVTVEVDASLQGNTESGAPTHTFTAYQIFTGTQAESEQALGDVQWGSGIDSTKFLAALVADTTLKTGDTADFSTDMTAAQVAEQLAKYTTNSDKAETVARLAEANKTGTGTVLQTGSVELAQGYYLIVDTTGADTIGTDSYNPALLQVTNTITIASKVDVPTLVKKVHEDDINSDSSNRWGVGWNDTADYCIGESVPFELLSLVPDLTPYTTYKYEFIDELSVGFNQPNPNDIKVYLSSDRIVDFDAAGNLAKGDTDITEYFTTKNVSSATTTNESGSSVNVTQITVACDNIKTIPGMAENKVIIVRYSATLNTQAEIGLSGNPNTARLNYSNNPNSTGSGSTGTTPDDTVIVFTYELDVTKTDGATKKLGGAEFVLLNESQEKAAIVDSNGKVTGWGDVTKNEDGTVTYPTGSTLTSAETTGLFVVSGLDADIYYLTETKAPGSYNLLTAPIKLNISTDANNEVQDWAGDAAVALGDVYISVDDGTSVKGDSNTGIVTTEVVNHIGASLPETGGMGTTLFYLLGGALALGAAVLLITRRRVGARR